LLICVSAAHAAGIIAALQDRGIGDAADIGEILDGPQEKIWVV
jgi:hydrogenase maturation factor